MRDWCVVFDTTSSDAAKQIGKALQNPGFDIDVMPSAGQVWCYAGSKSAALNTRSSVRNILIRDSLWEGMVQREPSVRVWSEARHTYVEPEHPEEDPDSGEVWIDSDLDPGEIHWRVRLDLESVFEFRRVRRQLPALRRPVIGTGNRTIDLGARDERDASEVADAARKIEGVHAAGARDLGGRLKRWWVRQRLAGNYSNVDDGGGLRSYHFDFGGADGSGGGGDGGGGHGGGGGGHGGH